MDGELHAAPIRMHPPQPSGAEVAIFVQRIKLKMKLFQTVGERFVVASNAVQSLEARVGRRHTLAHHFDYRVGAGNLDIFFAAPGRACSSDAVINKEPRTE